MQFNPPWFDLVVICASGVGLELFLKMNICITNWQDRTWTE